MELYGNGWFDKVWSLQVAQGSEGSKGSSNVPLSAFVISTDGIGAR